ncbi:MAG: hypothetical protein JRJ37_08885, partial [Deltaproteobacteria bacterium]|nr:hypothetical protein [Deltaproteobacteria bacterium]
SFVILSQDPRKHFAVLLDTKSHIVFAIEQGDVVVNILPHLTMQPPTEVPDSESQRSGWLAYEPPPLALPLTYHSSRKWNKFETRYISGLFNGALALDRNIWLSQDNDSQTQVGDLYEFNTGNIRALRVGLVGTLNFKTPWIYFISGATNAFTQGFDSEETDNFSLFDYRVDIPVLKDTTLSIGKQKEPISLERLTSMVFLPWQERAAVSDAFFPSRNHGVVVNGMGPGDWMTWAGGVFNNWIDADTSFDETANQYVGRITWVPFVSTDESNLLHLGGGLRYSDAKQGLRFKARPEVGDTPIFVDTDLLSANSSLTSNLELYWRKGPFWLGFEYTNTSVDSPEYDDPDFSGYTISGSWALTGEMRSYRKRSGIFNPLPVARPVNQGGWGAFEAAARHSRVDLNEGLVEGGDMNISSLGLNWWLTPVAQFSINYRYIMLDQGGMDGNSQEITSRLLLILD